MAQTPEGKVKAAVRRFLNKEGIWCYMPVQNGMGVVGIPDFIACRPVTVTPEMVGTVLGEFVAIETKAPGKKHNTTENQKRHLNAIREHGGRSFVADCVEDVAEGLSEGKQHG